MWRCKWQLWLSAVAVCLVHLYDAMFGMSCQGRYYKQGVGSSYSLKPQAVLLRGVYGEK